ncbi:spore germination protein (amino acid permease) [Paenibacillus endophyticus]|uniref:Spore germination protein (Amino acid permease) n=1 Tax=Paenibacillus endophyticus TaxID=1294268 RepID=A0A7W5C394_9BACL|nr:GerAB/ArcD/ProY family transporter [Paenibacillus endophyticus]MBB3150335.1 spore germination protein (amino acid permease) [Paenibacillus endophyticus]
MDKSLHVVLMYGLTQLGFIFFFYSGDIISSTTEGHWLAIVIGLVLNLVMVWLYMKGLGYFPKQDIISIYSAVGKWAAVLFLLPLVFFLFITNIITIRAFSEVITLVFLANTPLWAIMALIITLSGYIALNGVESIFRTGVLLAILFLPVILFTICISFQNVDFRYFFPVMDEKFSFLARPPYWHSFAAFAGSFLFLGFIQPYVAYRPKYVLMTVAALVPFYFIAVYVPLFTFGQATASTFKFPFIVLMSTIHINWLMFDRITMFLLLCLVTFTMLFISMVLWKLSQVLHRCLPKVKPSYFVIAIAAANFIGCLFITNWDEIQSLVMWNTMLRFFVMVGIPCSIWLLGIRAKRMIKDEGA